MPQSHLDLDGVRSILSEYKIHNADVTLRCDATADDLIDIVEGNRFSVIIAVTFDLYTIKLTFDLYPSRIVECIFRVSIY